MSMSSKKNAKIAVLSGGPTDEHPISIQTGQAAGAALVRLGFDVLDVTVERNGNWTLGGQPSVEAAEGIAQLHRANVNAGFIALHGPFGEDGTIQAILETLGLGYQGSGVRASALAMNKSVTKTILKSNGIPVPSEVRIARDDDISVACAQVIEQIGLPVFIKPAHLGSSVGAARGTTLEEVQVAITRGLSVDTEVIVEPLLTGQELTCGVLFNEDMGEVEALPSILIEPVGHSFFDYESKYTPGHNRELCPAPVSPEIEQSLRQLAVRCHEVVGCRDISRTDFILTPSGLQVLEINTLPGLTEASLIPQSAAEAGISFDQLVLRLTRQALTRTSNASH